MQTKLLKNYNAQGTIMGIYKITSIKSKTTKYGDVLYSLHLNNSTWVNNINPSYHWNPKQVNNDAIDKTNNDAIRLIIPTTNTNSFKKNMGRIDLITQTWEKNNRNLDALKGKYICATLLNSEYGLKLTNVISIDVLNDFENALIIHAGVAFYSDLPIYDFLLNLKYNKNEDNSISLKGKYNKLRVIKIGSKTFCYPTSELDDIVTLKNINDIFNQFYAPLKGGHGDEKYYELYDYKILLHTWRERCSNKMTTSGDYAYWAKETVLEVGNKLTKEHKLFLSTLKSKTGN